MFVKPAQSVNSYLSEPGYLENALKYSGQQKEQIEQIASYLVQHRPITFEECIIWARLQFEERYNDAIRQLLYSLPKDAVTNSGQPFWSSPKRAPDPLTFDSSDVRIVASCLVFRSNPSQARSSPIYHRRGEPPRVQLRIARGN